MAMTERELYEYSEDTRKDFEEILYNNTDKVLPPEKKTLNELTEEYGGSEGEMFKIDKTYAIGVEVSDESLNTFVSLTVSTGSEPSLNPLDWKQTYLNVFERGNFGINASGCITMKMSNTDPVTLGYPHNISSVSRLTKHNVEIFLHPDAKITDTDYIIYMYGDIYDNTNVHGYTCIYDKTKHSFRVNVSNRPDEPYYSTSDTARLYFLLVKK